MWGLDFIRKLQPAKWRYKPPKDDGLSHFGFIAQEVAKLAPMDAYNFVQQDGEFLKLNMWEFIGPMTKAIQELADKVDELEKRLAEKS